MSCLFGNRQPKRYEVISHCGFDFYFPHDLWCCSFHVLVGLCTSLEKGLLRSFTHFKIRFLFLFCLLGFFLFLFLFFCYWVGVSYTFWILTHFVGCLFILLIASLLYRKILCDVGPLVYFCFCYLCFRSKIQKVIVKTCVNVWDPWEGGIGKNFFFNLVLGRRGIFPPLFKKVKWVSDGLRWKGDHS